MGQDEKDFKKLEDIKEEYKELEMSKEQFAAMQQSISNAKREKHNMNKKRMARNITAAAAAIAVFVALPNTSADVAYAMSNIPVIGKLVEVVTFREYQYEDAHHSADITVPELTTSQNVDAKDEAVNAKNEKIKRTTDEMNAEIRAITDEIVAEFEENLKQEEGYQEVVVEHEIVAVSEGYFTLKLICYQGTGSGIQWNYFYTIDLATGERLALADLFIEGADYITPISENIKEQMRAQMESDENVSYWLEDEEMEEWNFEAITDATSFYVNADGNVVISFNEGDVAPMYMGCVEFVIPDEVVVGIRK